MPFIIQCPYADCGKFMLLEDADRGAAVNCLVCKRSIKLDPSHGGDPAGAANPAAINAGATKPVERQNVRTCTRCNTPLKVPAAAQNQRIRCPKCQNVF